MGMTMIFVLCSFSVGTAAQFELKLEPDRPFLSVPYLHKAELKCCYNTSLELNSTWVKSNQNKKTNSAVDVDILDRVNATKFDGLCGILTFERTFFNDSGLYQCKLEDNKRSVLTFGTYLHVYRPLEKTINLSENTKNRILTAEGILLLVCVILPSATLLCKSKKIQKLEKKKMKMEEENIYQGLNLDDCCTTYDQIERSQTHGPYQDVCNIMEEEEGIQLEKP